MARCLRVEYPGAIYHVAARTLGSWDGERLPLFPDDRDRERFLDQLAERVEQYEERLYAFCLMSNHIHLVLETPQGNLGRFMQSLSTAYTVYYNLRHDRHGHLFQGRYKAKLVEAEDYLLRLSRYVHLNPVQVGSAKGLPKAERLRALRSYPWSSYPSYIGRRKRLEFVDYEPLLRENRGRGRGRLRRYREYVESGLEETDEELTEVLNASPLSIGSESFCRWVFEQHQSLFKRHKRPEDVSLRRVTDEPLSWGMVLQAVGEVLGCEREDFLQRRRNSILRGVAARYLCRYGFLTQREVARLLGLRTGSAVSHQMRRVNERLSKDRLLRGKMLEIEQRLNEMRVRVQAMAEREASKQKRVARRRKGA